MPEKQMPKLRYDERLAFALVRKTIKRRPELAAALMEDMSKEVAVSVLLQAQQELKTLQLVARAFSEAAGVLAKATENPELILDGEES
jgi:hypothetical protein